jgi:hypothetical protein
MKQEAQQRQEWRVLVRNLWQSILTTTIPYSTQQVSAEAWEVETKCTSFSSSILPLFSFYPVTVINLLHQSKKAIPVTGLGGL